MNNDFKKSYNKIDSYNNSEIKSKYEKYLTFYFSNLDTVLTLKI